MSSIETYAGGEAVPAGTTLSHREHGRGRAGVDVRDLLVTLPFVVLFLINLHHHQLWRDELNAYDIAAAAPTLPALLHLVHYEGHPWLWYGVLWPATKIWTAPMGLKVVQGVIGTAIVLAVGLFSPFKRWEKALLLLGYFFLFEYTVMSRMYGVMVLLLLVYLWQTTRGGRAAFYGSFAVLGLMANADSTGLLLSLALLLERAVREEWWRRSRGDEAEKRQRPFLAGAAIYALLVVFAVHSLWPAHDISSRTTGKPLDFVHDQMHLWHAVGNYVALPYFPTATSNPKHFWNPEAQDHRHYIPIAVAGVLLAYGIIFRRHRSLLLMMAAILVMTIAFGHLIYMGSSRHYGVTFLAFLAGIWMMKARGERLHWAAYVLLVLTAVGGLDAQVESWHRKFSYAGSMADLIRARGMENMPLVGYADTSVIGVAEELDRPLYQLECQCSRRYLKFSTERDHFTREEIPDRLVTAQQRLGSPLLYVSDRPLEEDQADALDDRGFRITTVGSFDGAEAYGENFYAYELTRTDPTAVAGVPASGVPAR